MLKQPNLSDDLFEKSSMSFGEHLEELRKALVKAFLWLALGTGVGLFFATSVVKFIEQPLRVEMENFYLKQTAARFKRINNVEPPPELLSWMKDHSVIPERIFVDPAQLPARLEPSEGTATEPVAAPATPATAATKSTEKNSTEKSSTEKSSTEKSSTEKSSTEKNNTARTAAETTGDAKALQSVASPTTPSSDQATAAKATLVEASGEALWKELSAGSIERLEPLLIMRPIPNRLMTFDALEGFLIWLKAGLLVGAVIASPGIFYHIWEFLAAGLYPHERRYVYLYLPLSVILFVAGVSLAFFVIFKLVLAFLLTYNADMDIDFAPRLNYYISFALFLPLGFGIAFQLPIVMLGLNRFGIISTDTYVNKWRIAVLGIAFLSMVLTPADAYSMIGMFIPLTLLYFLGIALCKYMPKGPGLGSQAFDPT